MTITTTVSADGVDIDIEGGESIAVTVDELVAGGWEHDPTCERDHCDDGDCPECASCERFPGSPEDLIRAVTDWHDAGHESVLRFCMHPVCVAMGQVAGVRHG